MFAQHYNQLLLLFYLVFFLYHFIILFVFFVNLLVAV